MAKKIRFPLKMKDGAEVRTLDELRENFDLESVLGYFTDGKLVTWLADRYYDDKAEAVSALSADTPDLNAKLCEILEVEYQAEEDETDIELIARRREKLRILSSIIDDSEILNNIDIVAMDQDELFDILDESPEKVYLYGDKFSIPSGARFVNYIGINNPLVVLDKNKKISDYKNSGIIFSKVRFEENVDFSGEKLFVESVNYNGEKLFIMDNYKEAFPIIEKEAINGNPRSMYILGLYYSYGYDTIRIDSEQRNIWFQNGYLNCDPFASYWYARWCVDDEYEQSRIYKNIFDSIRDMANTSDIFAQQTIASMYENGRGVEKNESNALRYYFEAAAKNNAFAMNGLGHMYLNGTGTAQDFRIAFEWFKQAAEHGFALSQLNLGAIYYYGHGVERDYKKAAEWYRQAAEQGNDDAQCLLGDMYAEGYGVKQDIREAVKWYRLSALMCNEKAERNLRNHGITSEYSLYGL